MFEDIYATFSMCAISASHVERRTQVRTGMPPYWFVVYLQFGSFCNWEMWEYTIWYLWYGLSQGFNSRFAPLKGTLGPPFSPVQAKGGREGRHRLIVTKANWICTMYMHPYIIRMFKELKHPNILRIYDEKKHIHKMYNIYTCIYYTRHNNVCWICKT